MKTILTTLFSLAFVAVSVAQEKVEKIEKIEKKPAEQLLDLMKFKKLMTEVSNSSFAPFLDQLRQQGFPEAGVKEVAAAAAVYFDQVASDPGLKKEMMELYEKEFTKDELEQLVNFYSTPLGQKALHKLPALSQAGAKLGEKYAEKHQAGFKDEMTRIMQKYKKK